MSQHINVEIKARCAGQEKIRQILKKGHADYKGLDHQIDTYFKVSNGRLKLREGNIENHLIYYEREDKAGPRKAKVTLFETEPKSPLKQILETSLGVLVVVDKKREIYYIGNVKFHLDLVEELGTFVEIEARGEPGEEGKLREQCEAYMTLFRIREEDLLKVSYSDLLLT